MKGIIFTELVEMVEARFGLETADVMLEPEGLESAGAYTATGVYAHGEMVLLLTRLSALTGLSVPRLLQAYGEHLFERLRALFPVFFQHPRDAFEFLATVDDVVHVEVLKLYPDAELPRFVCEQLDERNMRLTYSSPRGLADLARGLIASCCRSYGEQVDIGDTDLSGGSMTRVEFLLTRRETGDHPARAA